MGKIIGWATLSCMIGGAALASDFSGHWTGPGVLTIVDPFTGTHTSDCELVEINIDHVPDRMTIQRYHAKCGIIEPDWGPHVMEIRDSKVYEDDEESGTFVNDLLKTLTSSGGIQNAFNLRLNPATDNPDPAAAVLESYYGVHSMTGTIVIEGNLVRD